MPQCMRCHQVSQGTFSSFYFGISREFFTCHSINAKIKTFKRIHPSFIGKRTDRVKSSPVIPQLTTLDGSPFPLPSLLDFDPEHVKLKMTSNANRFQDSYGNFRTAQKTKDVLFIMYRL